MRISVAVIVGLSALCARRWASGEVQWYTAEGRLVLGALLGPERELLRAADQLRRPAAS